MPTPVSHIIVAGTLGAALGFKSHPVRVWVLGAVCSMVPDLDGIGFWMGVPYDHLLGHRGITHSLSFAVLIAGLVVVACFRGKMYQAQRSWLFLYFFLATASHGVLDGMTNGGLGIAFFSPFDPTRYFLPFRPIEVSPISITGFLNLRGAEILMNEAVWLWVPCGFVLVGLYLGNRGH